MDKKKQLMALALCGLVSTTQAGEKEELLKLKNTTTNLIRELVKQGILTEQVADEMIKRAEKDAELQVQKMTATQKGEDLEPGEVRVPYVPEFVKEEIREDVRKELRDEVVGDVVQKAKQEKWGTPDALPDWVNRFKLSGDLRVRSQNDFYANDNSSNANDSGQSTYLNYQEINAAGGLSRTAPENIYLSNVDRHRFRERFRLAVDAKLADELKAGVRLATGNMPDPVSTNQTLGNTGSQYEFNLDRAFLKYELTDRQGFKWLTLAGGRTGNPWYVGGGEFTGGSELVWDTDLSFEGLMGTYRYSFDGASAKPGRPGDIHPPHSLFFTLGGFPLQETGISSHDKWMFGGQAGVDWGFENHDSIKVGIAYYDYRNLQARPNGNLQPTCDTNTGANNFSVPQFMQFGNTLAAICQDGAGNYDLFGLASDYNIINVNLSYDYAGFAPYHVIFGADYANNLGFNSGSVNSFELVNNGGLNGGKVSAETNAWQARIDFGWPKVERAGQWNVFTFYKYVERDAVLDAYSDSDFHLGGTNAKGWVIGGNYGLMKNVWFTGRWLSSNVISGPKYDIDTLQLDINTKF